MHRVIFACVQNAGRSQIAAALFNALADRSLAEATSGGTRPGSRVHPVVVEALRELGIDISERRPQRLTDSMLERATLVVTMGCGEECPVASGVERQDWPLSDPSDRPLAEVRQIRDDIHHRVTALIEARGWSKPPTTPVP